MEENEFVESCEFPAPYVRVRGRVSRKWQVHWSPCIRTFKPPRQEEADSPSAPAANMPTKLVSAAVVVKPVFSVSLLDYRGQALISKVVEPTFFAKDQEWGTFVTRLPYQAQTQSVTLSVNERVLGRLDVPTDRPYFSLLHPNEDDYIDPLGVLHLHWADHECRQPLTYFVRYSHNGADWLRPGVTLYGRRLKSSLDRPKGPSSGPKDSPDSTGPLLEKALCGAPTAELRLAAVAALTSGHCQREAIRSALACAIKMGANVSSSWVSTIAKSEGYSLRISRCRQAFDGGAPPDSARSTEVVLPPASGR